MSGKWPSLRPETPQWREFVTALVEHRTPCHEGDDWTADDPTAREAAALACRACPLLTDCHAAAESTGERWGVWAGIDRTRTTAKETP